MNLSDLSNEEIHAQAAHWRQEALRGNKSARGPAHEYEVELRRRGGGALPELPALHVPVPLAVLSSPRRWWFWRS